MGLWNPAWIRAQDSVKGLTEVPAACCVQPWEEGVAALEGSRCTVWKGTELGSTEESVLGSGSLVREVLGMGKGYLCN